MKILACADIHASKTLLEKLEKKSAKADCVIVAGDLSVFGDGLVETLRRLNKFNKPIFIVHGNHDDPGIVARQCKKMRNLTYIHKRKVRFNGFTLIGHGGEGFAQRSNDFERFMQRIKKNTGEKIIFVTHQPPYKSKIDYIWDHHGNKSYRAFIMRKKPILALCGHLHETAGMKEKLGVTKVVNPGGSGLILTI